MIQFRFIFFIIQFLTIGFTVYYALRNIDINHARIQWELDREMETFHVPPSLFKRGCTIERTQSKALFSTLMTNATTANGFKMIYFDRTNVEVSECQINNLNFNVARGAPTFDDNWLISKKSLELQLLAEADIVRENILSVHYSVLENKFWRLYKLLGFILTITFNRPLIKSCLEDVYTAVSEVVGSVVYMMISMILLLENIFGSIANFAYYYKALRDIIRILRVDSQTNNDNDNDSHNETDSDSSDDGGNNDGANADNDDVREQQLSQNNIDVPTRAVPEENLGRVTHRQPQSKGTNTATQSTEAISARPPPSSSTISITCTPTSTVLSVLPTAASTTDLPTSPTPATDPASNTINESTAVGQPITTLSADYTAASQPATTVNAPPQTTLTPTTEAPPVGQSMTNPNKPSKAPSNDLVSIDHPAISIGGPSATLPDPAQEDTTPSDADASTPNQRRNKTTSGRRLNIRKLIAFRPIFSENDARMNLDVSQSPESLPKNLQTIASAPQVTTAVPALKNGSSIITRRRDSNEEIAESSTASSSEATAIAGRIIKPLPIRFRKFQQAKTASTASSSAQQVSATPPPSAAPAGALPATASSSYSLGDDRVSESHFVIKKRRTRSAPIPSVSPQVASSVEEPTEDATPATSSSSTADVSHGEPPPGCPTFNFIFNGLAVINFNHTILPKMTGNFHVVHQEVAAEMTNTQPLHDDTPVPNVQDLQPQQDAPTASHQCAQYDTIAHTPHYYQQNMVALDTQHLQQGPSNAITSCVPDGASFQYGFTSSPAFSDYNNMRHQHPFTASQYLHYTTTPMDASNQTSNDDDDGLEQDLTTTMNDMFGDAGDPGVRNIYVPESACSTIPQQFHQRVAQSGHDQSTFAHPIYEDINVAYNPNYYYNGDMMQGDGHNTTASSMTPPEAHYMESIMANRIHEVYNDRIATTTGSTTIYTYHNRAANLMVQPVYDAMPNTAVAGSRSRNLLRQKAAFRRRLLKQVARKKRYNHRQSKTSNTRKNRMRRRLTSEKSDGGSRRLRLHIRRRYALNQAKNVGETFAATTSGHYMAPKAHSNAEVPIFATGSEITNVGVTTSIISPYVSPLEATHAATIHLWHSIQRHSWWSLQ